MRRGLSALASPVLLAVSFAAIALFVISFIKPMGMSKDWVDDYRNSSSVYRNGYYYGAAGQGGRKVLLSKGVFYDHAYAFGVPNADRNKIIRHEHPWYSDTSGTYLSETILGFSCVISYGPSGDYRYTRQVSFPLLFIALVAGVLPLINFIARRRRIGMGFSVENRQDNSPENGP
jgi:hypothetical protein